MRTGMGGRPTWAGDVPARNLMNADNGPSPAWNAPTVALPVGSDLRRKAEELRRRGGKKNPNSRVNGDGDDGVGGKEFAGKKGEEKEEGDDDEEQGNFLRWMVRGERGYTRTPGDLRRAYDAIDGGGGGGGGAGGEKQDNTDDAAMGGSTGLNSMASVREAIKSASAAAATRANRSQLGSHAGIV